MTIELADKMNVRAWLKEQGLEAHADEFAENGVDLALLPELSNDDLKDLGVARLADRKRLLAAIENLGGRGEGSSPQPASPEPAQGERRQVTAMFTDLAGFTELSTQLDPEDLHDLITRFYEVVDGMIERYGGTVDKHLGDGVMALFGAPRAHGDDPLRAVRAAFDIHAGMVGLSQQENRDLMVHIGIASGEVIAGDLGGDGNKQYTVLGDSVNLASRLDSLANNGETMIDEMVHRAVTDHVECAPLGDVPIKGLDAPVKVWRAESLRHVRSNTGRSPFVGRRGELRQFEGALASCKEDSAGQAVLIRGEAGMGKTRLLEEFTDRSEAMGFSVHKGLVLDFGVGTGQDAIGALVRSLLGVVGDDEAQRDAACETAIADAWVADNKQVFLRDLLDLPQPSDLLTLYDGMENAARNQGKRDVVASLINAVANRQPTILIIEDIHWADTQILDQLALITATVFNTAALLVMTSRIEGDPLDNAWRATTRGSPLMTLDLGPLRPNEALELAGDISEEKRSTAMRCIERADGNPLFLEQLLRNAEESQNESEDESVPASIQSLVLARVDRLHGKDKESLQAAAVIGQRFAASTLRYLMDDADLDFSNLVNQQLIRPEGDAYLFSHALIQEGVYSSLLKKRRQSLHQKAATLFGESDPVLKALHLDRAEDPAAAAAYLDAATLQASAYHYEQALRMVVRGLELATDVGEKFTLTCTQGKLLHDMGTIDPSIQAYEDAHAMATNDAETCRALLGMAAGLRIADRYDEALDILDKAEAVASQTDMASVSAKIHHMRGNLYFPMGRMEECAAEHEKSLAFAKQAQSAEAEADALGGVADASYMAGRMATGFQYFSRCTEVARDNGLGGIEVVNASMVGFTRVYLNQLEGSMEDATTVIATAQKVGHQRAEMLGESLASLAAYMMADFKGSRLHTENALELSRQLGAPRFDAQALIFIGKTTLAEGRAEDAVKVLQTGIEISANVGHGFAGPHLFSALARSHTIEAAKREALAEGERLLAAGAVSHNHLNFYPDAIDVALGLDDWGEALRYATALEDYAKAEPLPWATFFTARGRALAAWGNGQRDDDLTSQIQALRDEAAEAKIVTAVAGLDAALTAR